MVEVLEASSKTSRKTKKSQPSFFALVLHSVLTAPIQHHIQLVVQTSHHPPTVIIKNSGTEVGPEGGFDSINDVLALQRVGPLELLGGDQQLVHLPVHQVDEAPNRSGVFGVLEGVRRLELLVDAVEAVLELGHGVKG